MSDTPDKTEFKTLNNALTYLGHQKYTKAQQESLGHAFYNYLSPIDEANLKPLFIDTPDVINSLKVIHNFAVKFQDNSDLIQDLEDEFDVLMEFIIGQQEDDSWVSL